jgi:NAD(P)-dependent dehydrogenase (short-subunit alcohol dehydrogenase family)
MNMMDAPQVDAAAVTSRFNGPLKRRVAWVTGGARGIGAAIAKELRERGAIVHATDLCASDNVDACDMRDPKAIADYVAGVSGRRGRLDILVNNAAIQRRRSFVDFTEGDCDDVFGTNVRGAFFAAQASARAMVAGGRGGVIVNVSSVNATHAQAETALYCASKGAIHTMTRALAVALGRYGIRVNAVAPGTVATGLNRDRLADDDTVHQVMAATALGRLGAADDVAPAIAFLASDEARFITGASLAIHGGWTLTG